MSANRIEDSEDWVTATLRGQIDGVTVTVRVDVPQRMVHPRELLSTYEQMTDAFVEFAVSREEAAGRKISCGAGCGACCRQLVPISEIEARHVADLVAALPSARQQVIRDRFAQARQKLQQADWLEPLQDPDQFPETTLSELGLAYFRLGIPCPFLEEESCSIHPDRPLACREYLVTSPAANCAAEPRYDSTGTCVGEDVDGSHSTESADIRTFHRLRALDSGTRLGVDPSRPHAAPSGARDCAKSGRESVRSAGPAD